MHVSVTSNAAKVGQDLAALGVATGVAVQGAVRTAGATLQTKVKSRASGRPGPRAQTGDYRRSISLQVRRTATGEVAEVGTNAVQGWRLEAGYWGLVDSLGRLFHQPAYPHFGPAADEMEPVRAWLRTQSGRTVTFARAPKAGVPPFTVLQIVGDARPLLTLDGGIPVELVWQIDCLGETAVQAIALGDKCARAMILDDTPDLIGATAIAREAVGDSRAEMIAENRFMWQQRFRWTLIAASIVTP